MRSAGEDVTVPEGAPLPCIVQDAATGRVLMLAYVDAEAMEAEAHRRGALSLPLARPAVAQGRDIGQRSARGRDPGRLRRRCDPDPGAPGRADVPYGRGVMLRRRGAGAAGAGRRDRRAGSIGPRGVLRRGPARGRTGDIPLLTPEAVDDFLSRCQGVSADIYYSIVSKEANEAAYPGVKGPTCASKTAPSPAATSRR